MGSEGFDLFISDYLRLYDGLLASLPVDRARVARAARRALAVLRAYRPADEGQEILIETAIEEFEDLVLRAGGR